MFFSLSLFLEGTTSISYRKAKARKPRIVKRAKIRTIKLLLVVVIGNILIIFQNQNHVVYYYKINLTQAWVTVAYFGYRVYRPLCILA